MADTDNATNYYIRVRGRVLGPYTVKQLHTLRTRGQFGQSNEISTDGKSWEPASSVESLFEPARRASKRTSDEPAAVASDDPVKVVTSADRSVEKRGDGQRDDTNWHYSVGGEQIGPVSLTVLKELLRGGRLSLADFVWMEGMSEWRPAAEVAELNPAGQSKRGATAKSAPVGVSGRDAKPNGELAKHFLDGVLQWLRNIVRPYDFAATAQASIEFGRYAVYLSILLNVVYYFLSAVKLDRVSIGLMGLGFAAAALVFQYSAVKSCGAISLMLSATTTRMSSTAFLDSLAIMNLVGGIVALVASAVVWMQTEQIATLLIGVAVCVACEQLAMMLLHPRAIGITITPRASSGEEAIAILSFFMMLPLRSVPGVFALGTAISTLGTGYAFYLMLATTNGMPDSLLMAFAFGQMALVCAGFPFAAYLYFAFSYVLVDLVRSILVLPDKIDQVRQRLTVDEQS